MLSTISIGVLVTAGFQVYVSTKIAINTYKAVKIRVMKNKYKVIPQPLEMKEEV